MSTSTGASRAAHIISDVFSPLLVPTYTMAAALWLTLLRFIPLSAKLWSLSGVFFITAALPALVIFALIKAGKVSDAAISDRTQRTVPYTVAILCYGAAAWYVNALQAPHWLTGFFVGAGLTALLSLVITHWWKISAHTAGTAGATAALYWMAVHGLLGDAGMTVTCIVIAVTGAVAWARLYLNHHTPAQVLAGAAMAALVTYFSTSVAVAL